MNEASAYLLNLARQVAEPYRQQHHLRALIVTGSVADGNADPQSDLDMIAYYNGLPSDDELMTMRQQNRGENFTWLFNERAQGSIAEAYDVSGVHCQIMHNTIAAWEQRMSTVLEQFEVGTPLHKAMSGVQNAIPLHGADLIQQWKDRIGSFPEPLARSTIEHHLQFFPLWGLQAYMDTCDAVLWRYQTLLEAAYNILGVLAGSNRRYYTTFQLKHMRHFTAKLTITPANLNERIKHLFEADSSTAAAELEQLVAELVDLVERHMPEIDTSSVGKRIGWRRPSWHMPSDAAR